MTPAGIEATRARLHALGSPTTNESEALRAITQMQDHIAMLTDSYGRERALRLDAQEAAGEDGDGDKDARIAELEAALADATEEPA